MPLTLSIIEMAADRASECATEQGRFWQMRDALFENQDALWGDTAGVAKQLAAKLGLNTAQVNRKFHSLLAVKFL